MRRQELVLVGQVLEDARQPVVADEREHRGASVLAQAHRRRVLRPRVQEPGDPLAELRQAPAHTRGLPTATAQSGIRPVIDRTRTGTPRAVGAPHAVVVEAVVLVPQAVLVDGAGDHREVLEELHGDVLVRGVLGRQDDRDLEHGQAIDGHPARAVGLLEHEAVGQGRRAVERTDVVHAEEAAAEQQRCPPGP